MIFGGKAFFDESSNEKPGYYAVAGFVGSQAQWNDFGRMWGEALDSTGAPYLHMREFAHSVDAFEGWKGQKDRREKLMDGVVKAVRGSALIPVGSAMRIADFEALPEEGRSRLRSPYHCCLQDVLYGFALMAEELKYLEPLVPALVRVTGDQHADFAADAKRMYKVLRGSSPWFDYLGPELGYADMRVTPGLQSADLLAYEMTKELANQDLRPEDRMRWPLDQIIDAGDLPFGKALKYNTAAMLRAQGDGSWMRDRTAIIQKELDESLRVLRNKSGPFKDRLQDAWRRK